MENITNKTVEDYFSEYAGLGDEVVERIATLEDKLDNPSAPSRIGETEK